MSDVEKAVEILEEKATHVRKYKCYKIEFNGMKNEIDFLE